MNLRVFLVAAIASLSIATAKVSRVNHDQVQPFDQPEPITDSQKSAVKYKPQLHISYGCHPYPAVQANGSASGGLEWSGPVDGDCRGSPLGRYHVSGHRHYWEYAIVWTDSPTSTNSSILGVSMYAGLGYGKTTPPMLKYIDGSSIKLDSYFSRLGGKAALQLTKANGEFQALITWDQLSVAARETLNGKALDGNVWLSSKDEVPFKDENFMKRLRDAFPF